MRYYRKCLSEKDMQCVRNGREMRIVAALFHFAFLPPRQLGECMDEHGPDQDKIFNFLVTVVPAAMHAFGSKSC